MDHATRRAEILAMIERQRSCSIQDLAAQFSVSDETIRRDVRELEQLGHVQKVHGAVRLPVGALEAPFRLRQQRQAEAKRRIGAAAAALIGDGATLFLDGSTTAIWVARHLQARRNLSVVTNGLEVAREFAGFNAHRIFMAGGELSEDYMCVFGAGANAFVARFSFDFAIFGVSAIHPELGFCDVHLPEAELIRTVLPRAARRMVVADATKFAARAPAIVAAFDEVQTLVTDAPAPEPFQAALAGVEIIRAAPAQAEPPPAAKLLPGASA